MNWNDKGGIYSLAGFAYQIKVFVLHILQLKKDSVLRYEAIDDVSIGKVAEKLDEYEDVLSSVVKTNNTTAVQVKKTQITDSVAKRVIKNWVIVDSNHNVENFVLITDREVSENIFKSIDVNDVYNEIDIATGGKSIDARIKLIGYSKEDLLRKIADIISKSIVKTIEDIDENIKDEFSDYFLKPAIKEVTYCLRIKDLMQYVTVAIMESVSKGVAYELKYEDSCIIKDRIISKITDEKWEPSFSSFKKINKLNLKDLAKIKKREFFQLKECKNLNDDDIFRHLLFGEYYENSKRLYFECGKYHIVEAMETTAYENFCDVKMELRYKSEDTPDNRLFETKKKSNNKATDEQIKYGVCISLTSDNTDESKQISWKDE